MRYAIEPSSNKLMFIDNEFSKAYFRLEGQLHTYLQHFPKNEKFYIVKDIRDLLKEVQYLYIKGFLLQDNSYIIESYIRIEILQSILYKSFKLNLLGRKNKEEEQIEIANDVKLNSYRYSVINRYIQEFKEWLLNHKNFPKKEYKFIVERNKSQVNFHEI